MHLSQPGGCVNAEGEYLSLVPSVRPDHLDRPDPRRLRADHPRYDEIGARHRAAVVNGNTSYRDPVTGFMVFTSAFLAERGYCCSSGCRHCPFVGAGDSAGDSATP
jgi:hypothetical protein